MGGWRRRRGAPLLAGVGSVGSGVLVAGICTYLFLGLAGRVLGPAGFTPVSTLWALLFIVGPGLFLPVQQELGRVIGGQRAARGGGHALLKVALLAAGFAVTATALAVATHEWIVDEVFAGDTAMLWCFGLGLWAYALMFVARGILSGLGEFSDFGWLIAAESVVRLVAGVALTLTGAGSAAGFGAAIALSPLVALAVVTRMGRGLRLHAGDTAGWREVTRAMGWLVLGAFMAQSLANAGPLAVQLLADESELDRAGRFLSALVVARLALYLFQAVQATLLPDLAQMVARGQIAELKGALRRVTLVCTALIVVTTLGSFLLGSFAVRVVFGPGFAPSDTSMAVLTGATGFYVLAVALSGAAIAAAAHRLSASAWMVGFLVFAGGAALVDDLFLRVEVGYLLGSVAAAGVLLVGLPLRLRSHTSDAERPVSRPGAHPPA